jgi:hypothetical protein
MASRPPSRAALARGGLSALFSLAAAIACAGPGPDAPKDGKKAMSKQERRWEVREKETLILELSDAAGAVSGPSGSSTPSAFLTARIVSPGHEARLRELLQGAGSVPELVGRLMSEGYRVKLTTPRRRWRVFDGDKKILEVSDVPGAIVDTSAPPPPGLKPTYHPFLSATAYSAPHGDKLQRLLQESSGVDDYLERLRSAGFRVEPLPD